MIIDTHCHLDQPQFDDDRAAVLDRAAAAGVTTIIDPATDLASCHKILALSEAYPEVYAAVGVHPNDCAGFDDETLAELAALAARPKVVAIGEIGLDYYWDPGSADLQQRFLDAQLDLASELNLPVAVHDREAHTPIIETLRRHRGKARGVLHAFSGDEAMAREAFDLGFLISLGGPITFLNARRAPALVAALPLDTLVIETDSPYLAPHPLRGRRNEPANVVRVAERIAELKGLTVQQVAVQTAAAARALFGF